MQFGGFAAASTLSRCALGGLELSLQLFVTASLLASAYAAWRRRESRAGKTEARLEQARQRSRFPCLPPPLCPVCHGPCKARPLQSDCFTLLWAKWRRIARKARADRQCCGRLCTEREHLQDAQHRVKKGRILSRPHLSRIVAGCEHCRCVRPPSMCQRRA